MIMVAEVMWQPTYNEPWQSECESLQKYNAACATSTTEVDHGMHTADNEQQELSLPMHTL